MSFLRSDAQLLLAFREGRADALERVYRAYVRPVERYLRALARTRHVAAEIGQASAIADLLQDVFLRAFAPAARLAYDGLRDYGPYLFTIARNCFVDALRARGREVLLSSDEVDPGADGAGPELGAFADPRVLDVLSSYVASLPDAMRSICERRFVLGESQDEVSATLGISRRSLRTGEARLRRGLRKALVRAGISLHELREADGGSQARDPVAAVVVDGGGRS